MLEFKAIIQQKTHLFENIATRWHQATQGELALLSLQGEIIEGYNSTHALYQKLIDVSPEREVQIVPLAKAIIAPVLVNGEVSAHLLSNNSTPDMLPMLNWVAEAYIENLNNEQALEGMSDELIAAWDQLDLVYRITKTLAEGSNLSDTLNSSLQEIIDLIKVEMGFILLTHDNHMDCVTAGLEQLPTLVCQQEFVDKFVKLNQVVLCNERDSLLEFWPEAPDNVHSLLGIFIATNVDTAAALGLINNHQRNFTAGDVKLITAVSEQIGAIIDNSKLHQELIVQERVQRELEIAAEIQDSLLPKIIPEVKGVTLDFSIIPAHEVGGDFYDFISTDENHLTIFTGDVAGKGVPAAMFTSMVRNMLKIESLHSQDPHDIIKQVNQVLFQDLWQAELFVTACVAIFDTKAKVLMYANAAHTPGIIYHAQSKTSRLLKATSLPIGIKGYAQRTTQYVHLSPGDTLVLYSDGVSEAENLAGERFDFQRIQYLVHLHADEPPDVLKKLILKELADFQQTQVQSDDITLIVIRFSPEDGQILEGNGTVVRTVSFQYKANTIHLTEIAEQVSAACRTMEYLPADMAGDNFVYLVELAVSEICTNTIEHAYASQEGDIIGEITLMTTGIQIDIYDRGNNFNPNDIPPPISDPLNPSEGGYGLHIVRQVMDVAEYTINTRHGNHWKLIKYLPKAKS